MNQFRTLLGAKVDDIEKLHYPLFASTKLDGIRAHWFGKEFLSRTLKAIPNRNLQTLFSGLKIPEGLDGELIIGEPNDPNVYRSTNSVLMSHYSAVDTVRFFVFDNYCAIGNFYRRAESLYDIPPFIVKLDQVLVSTPTELADFEENCLRQGYEGVCLRAPEGKYKFGRSTLSEQYLLKLKRFSDAEATVVGFEELLHNANKAILDERGYTKRSSHQDNKVPMGILGSLVVRMGEMQFNIGTGFTESERVEYWKGRNNLLGHLAKFKYMKHGMKNVPRHPVFLGWRSVVDY